MEHHGGHRVPLSALYGLLALLFVWSGVYLVPMTIDLLRYVFAPSSLVANPFLADWPDGELRFPTGDAAARATPPLARGDRLVSVDGLPFRTEHELARQVESAGSQGTLAVVVRRKAEDNTESEVAARVALRSFAEVPGSLALRAIGGVVGIVMPWVCFLVGFWVAAVRPRDSMAWLVLLTLLGFQVGSWEFTNFKRWPDEIRLPAIVYRSAFNGLWPLWFTLFGTYFAGRLPWERRWSWVKWILLIPVVINATGLVVATLIENLDLRNLAALHRAIIVGRSLGQVFSIAAVSFFFMNVGWKSGLADSADARRRLRLIQHAGAIALTPVLVIIIATWILARPLDAFPLPVLVLGFIFVPVFPLTLAYVILVDRALDVRVAVRQGLRYAVTRGVIRAVVGIIVAGVLWNVWNLLNDPTANRPRKIQVIAVGVFAAVGLPRFSKRAFDWTDRRFFRESYNTERVLTELSEEVRTIAETDPLLDTVLERIGSTLHVDRLAVFLREGTKVVPSRSRGFDPPPSITFTATDEAILRLRESGRPLRVRHDDPENPLRREHISEENRAKLQELDAELVLPLNGKNDLLGIITLGPKKSEESYSLTDAKLLGSVASQTGLALENSRLMATIAGEIAKRELIGREIDIARSVQQRLFPQSYPKIAGVDCAGYCRPAHGIGGDYYDFLTLSGGRMGIALGDVAGKGIPAALLMASLQASLRGQRLSGPADLGQLMTNLNFLIHEASPENRYATFFYGELDTAARRLDYVNAGHNAPMIFRAGGEVERLRASGPVVGLVDAARFEQRSVGVGPGDVLVVYSDGISEAMNASDEEWGEGQLADAARSVMPCEPQKLIDKLFAAADAFAGGAVQHDDMTVVVVRMTA